MALPCIVCFLLLPQAAAQDPQAGTGHVTIDVWPHDLSVNATRDGRLGLWVNMTIACDLGDDGFLFPRLAARFADQETSPLNITPDPFVPAEPFERTQIEQGQPTTYEYVFHLQVSVGVKENRSGEGTARVTWVGPGSGTALLMVPPACTAQGWRWVVDRTDNVTIEYEAMGPEWPDEDLVGRIRPMRSTIAEEVPAAPKFAGESRVSADAFAALGAGVLAAVAMIGLGGWVRRAR